MVLKTELDEIYADDGSLLQRFPRRVKATIVRLNGEIADQPIGALREDGVSGKNFTIVMINRSNVVNAAPCKWEVQRSPCVDDRLEFWTPLRAERCVRGEVKGTRVSTVAGVEENVPLGAVVDTDDGLGGLTCTLRQYDPFPQVNTVLEEGQLLAFGCPEKCRLKVGKLTAAGAMWLRNHIDVRGILTKPLPICEKFLTTLPDTLLHPELEVPRGSKRVESVSAGALNGGMPHCLPEIEEGISVTFEYTPHDTLRHLLRSKYGVSDADVWSGYFDLDYFTLSAECVRQVRDVGDVTLRELGIRERTGVTLVGLARLRPDPRLHHRRYDIVWFPGPDEIVKAGDLGLVMREPSSGLHPDGDSVRAVRDEDIADFAEPAVQPEDEPCLVCMKAPISIKFLPCNHEVVCAACAERLSEDPFRQCIVCNQPIHQYVFGHH